MTEPSTTDPATAAELRALIDRDCPHRRADLDRHLAGRDATPADLRLWRTEHAISSQPAIEAQLDSLYRQAADSTDHTTAKHLLEQASQLRHNITEGLR